jgi:hypothetical protein
VLVELVHTVAIVLLLFFFPGPWILDHGQSNNANSDDDNALSSSDVTAEWYRGAGILLSSFLFANLVLSVLVAVLQPTTRLRQWFFRRRARTQHQLNQALAGPTLELYSLYASLNVSLIAGFLYAAVLPVVVLFSAVKLVCLYVIERYNLFRRYQTPPMLDSRLASFTRAAALLSCTLHLVFSFECFRPYHTLRMAFTGDSWLEQEPRSGWGNSTATLYSTFGAETTLSQRWVIASLGLLVIMVGITLIFSRVLRVCGLFLRIGTCCGFAACRQQELKRRRARLEAADIMHNVPYTQIAGVEAYCEALQAYS